MSVTISAKYTIVVPNMNAKSKKSSQLDGMSGKLHEQHPSSLLSNIVRPQE